MKILMISPYVTLLERPEFRRNETGFGYMVYDIAKAVGKIEKVDVLCTDSLGDRFEDDEVTFLKRSFVSYLSNIRYCLPICYVNSFLKCYSMQKATFLRVLFYWFTTGFLSSLIKNNKYDIVHIHGCGFATELWMQVCKDNNQKYVVTLHGLNSFSDTVKLEAAGKKYERDFLQRVVNGEIPITVISTGMKRLIEKTYNVENCINICVVCNSFAFNYENVRKQDIRSIYGIPQDAFIILYVGNISENKNQKQMIKAFSLLPERLQKATYILFCGRPNESCKLEQMIAKQAYRDHLILCGNVDKKNMPDYYLQANGVALLSYTEGFGLSLIEGMHFGVTGMMFDDMDAFEDIYDPCAMVAIGDRENTTVARGLEKLLEYSWDSEVIKTYACKFESGAMAKNYIGVYNEICLQ